MPPVIATINFQIMGKADVALGGAAASVGTLTGPYWNTIQIIDPSLNYVTFTPLLGQEWEFVMWGGGVVDGTLPIATDVSAGYLAVAVFAEPPRGTPAPFCPCRTTVTAAPPEPTHESIRIANRVRDCTQTPPSGPSPSREFTTTRTVCGPAIIPDRRWARQTAAQNTPPAFLAPTDSILQTSTSADRDENQYVVSRWYSPPFSAITVFSLDISGAQRWRTDIDLGVTSTGFEVNVTDPCVAILCDPNTARVFVVASALDTAAQILSFHFFVLATVNGTILGSQTYTGPWTNSTIPPLALTLGANSLYLASSNPTTVFIRRVRTDGTFNTIEYWAGLQNISAAPLVASCYGIHYDTSGHLYLNLNSTETIQGGTRILSPYDPLANTIVVKLRAAAIVPIWTYQSPALNTRGLSTYSTMIVANDLSVRVIYANITPNTSSFAIGYAHISADGALLARHDLPEYNGSLLLGGALCKNTAGTRTFFLFSHPEETYGVSIGEISNAGNILWYERNATYSPPLSFTSATIGAVATDRHFWVAYRTRAPILDQVQTTPDRDAVAIQFALRECFTITETECICSPIPQAQDFRTVERQIESNRILREAVRCPLHFQNRDTGGLCGSQHTAVHSDAPSPYTLTTARPFSRIRGIEEICRPVRNVSASELTARIRSRTETSNAALQRHSEHRRVFPPPRPCRVYQTGPQAGVPVAPVTPCLLANQRVDYSPPTK